ncbi:Cell division protein FtsZ [hydrothermal vent metagenome]|uniref:Cell division protein FtsZ n=1 Tax=hydrothermal vent metagenome TaxID=652676 RepID=A0A3B1CBN8_9ZZZZ
MFEIEELMEQTAKIRVIGVGGAGGNAVNNMIAANLKGIDFIAINTDLQVLETSLAPQKIQIGADLTRGLGAGSNPEIGRQAALHDYDAIAERLQGSDMVFITAGMGGGTGTGASSVVASIARELGALTVAVITKPFFYEGKKRLMNAEEGIKELRQHVDTIIVIPNDRISLVVEKGTPLLKSFTVANNVLRQAVQGISDLILTPGLINLDFADVKTVIEDSGRAVIGIGSGNGEAGAVDAAKKAISNPLLEDSSVEGARGILVNITGGIELSLSAVQEATALIYDSAHEDVNIIFGAVIDSDMTDEVRITVIATGFEPKKEKVVLEDVKTWRPKPSVQLKLKAKVEHTGAERVLSKTLKSMPAEPLPTELMSYDDPYDMPSYLRKSE